MAGAILTTARLSLRCFTADDAGWLLGRVNDPAWLANIGDRGVRTEGDAAAYIEDRLVAGCRAFGFGFWAVERRTAGGALRRGRHRTALLRLDGTVTAPLTPVQRMPVPPSLACIVWLAGMPPGTWPLDSLR